MYVCSNHFEDNCFDSSRMIQSTLTYSDRTIFGSGLYCLSSFLNFAAPPPLPPPHNPALPLPLFSLPCALTEWMIALDLICIWLNGIQDLQMLNNASLVPEGPYCALYATKRQVSWGLKHYVVFPNTLIWYHTHSNKDIQHTQGPTNWHTHINILTPPVMSSQQLSILH